jgi:hypothetical protein
LPSHQLRKQSHLSRHERITSWENPISKAAWQIKQACKHLPLRPIILLDSEYGNASLLNQTAQIEADLLMRIRSNRWTVPQLSTPCQCERWSDLMPILTWELWLARDLVAQHHLPWQKPLSNLTLGRVAQSIALLLPEIGTPAVSPKPRGKSPGC